MHIHCIDEECKHDGPKSNARDLATYDHWFFIEVEKSSSQSVFVLNVFNVGSVADSK